MCWRTLSDEGALTLPDGVPSTVTVERPRQKEHGDYATNVALQLAKKAGMNPRELAGQIQERLVKLDGIAAVEIAGPGFLNVTVEAGAQAEVAAAGRGRGGRVRPFASPWLVEKINLEFVSANPTGPLHLGGVRWAAVGDALGRVLEAAGAEVTREYYFNDRGRADRPVRRLAARQRRWANRSPRTATAATTSTSIAHAVVAARPDVLGLPRSRPGSPGSGRTASR